MPRVVFSENGPQYSSHKFKSKSWDFIQRTSSPMFPLTNKFLERAIQTIIKTLQKCKEYGRHQYLAKNSFDISSSELFIKGKLQTVPGFYV